MTTGDKFTGILPTQGSGKHYIIGTNGTSFISHFLFDSRIISNRPSYVYLSFYTNTSKSGILSLIHWSTVAYIDSGCTKKGFWRVLDVNRPPLQHCPAKTVQFILGCTKKGFSKTITQKWISGGFILHLFFSVQQTLLGVQDWTQWLVFLCGGAVRQSI